MMFHTLPHKLPKTLQDIIDEPESTLGSTLKKIFQEEWDKPLQSLPDVVVYDYLAYETLVWEETARKFLSICKKV